MAAGNLPPPAALDIHSEPAGERWRRFKRAWDSYALATGLTEKAEAVQVATLLTVIGEQAREVYSTFTGWAREGDSAKIGPVLEKFRQYCEPRKNVPFERYRFNRRCQEPGETYDHYNTELRKLGIWDTGQQDTGATIAGVSPHTGKDGRNMPCGREHRHPAQAGRGSHHQRQRAGPAHQRMLQLWSKTSRYPEMPRPGQDVQKVSEEEPLCGQMSEHADQSARCG